MKSTILRRDVLKTGGALVVGFLFNPAARQTASAQNAAAARVHPGKTVDLQKSTASSTSIATAP